MEKTNKSLEETFASRKEEYGIETIRKFSLLADRINVAKELLNGHYNLLPIFTYLEKNTLTDVVLSGFSLTEKDDKIQVTAQGLAPDLTDLQLQSKAYARNPNVSDLVLSNISKTKEGFSSFNLEFSVNKKFLTERTFVVQN